MPCILIERFGPRRPTARVDALAVVLQRLLCRFGLFFGEQNIGVRAERRDRERLISEGYTFARFGLIPCLVHDVLRFVSGALGAGRTLPPAGLRTIASWKAYKDQTTNPQSDPRWFGYWERVIEGLRKAGMPEE